MIINSRNPYVIPARQRKAGKHKSKIHKRLKSKQAKIIKEYFL
jgi:hypothetical protein